MKTLLLFLLGYFLLQDPSVVQTGIASYYGKKFQNRKTSSGERYHRDSLTAAHKTLAFGSRVIVKNLSNDKEVVVKINDRLPGKSKRLIDLSYAAAKKLDFVNKGITRVEVRPEL